ncbi:MAG: cytochrome P450, partial [Benjaminiella poitrasii]
MDTMTRTLGATALAFTGLLALKYPDRAVFDQNREGIAHKKGWPLVGGLPEILSNVDNMHDFFLTGFTRLNSLTTTASALGMPRTIATIDPRNIEHILKYNFENYAKGPQLNAATGDLFGHGIFNANGEQWKYQRKTASLIFNVKNFRDHFTEVFVKELKVMFNGILDKAVEQQSIIDFHDIMFKFTLDSFILLGFGVELKALETEDKVPFAASFDACQLNSFQRFVNPLWRLTEPIVTLLRPTEKTIAQHLETVDAFANQVIENRRKNLDMNNNNDLLSRFMNARNERHEPLNNKELRDIILNFVIAGRDTTAQALSWTLYMLLLHPRVEKQLLKEIEEQQVVDELMEEPVALYEKIKDMTYAHAIFYEVLRLFPSVPNNQKYALNDDIWPDGTTIRKGDYVMWCPWAQGRSEAVWGSDAKEFRPERWIVDGELRRESQGQWPAFHAGPRVCLGQNLATLEALVALVFLIKQYKFKLVPGQNITYQVSLTLPMKEGMKVYVEKR